MTSRVLVCGGSGGVGGALCDELASRGYRPIVGYAQSRERAQAIAERTCGEALALDLEDPPAIERALDAMLAEDTPVVGVVLAATAPLELRSFSKWSAQDLERQWCVHVEGPRQLLAGLVQRAFRKRRHGTVIGVLSQAMGRANAPAMAMLAPYVIAKHGLAGLLAALAADYPWLDVQQVAPGFTRTSLLDAFDPRFLAQLEATQPFSTPEEVAREIAALLPGSDPLVLDTEVRA